MKQNKKVKKGNKLLSVFLTFVVLIILSNSVNATSKGYESSEDNINLAVSKASFWDTLKLGEMAIYNLEPSYKLGETISIQGVEKIDTPCSGNDYFLVIELYAGNTFEEGFSKPIANPQYQYYTFDINYFVTSTFGFNDWSVASYIYCHSEDKIAGTVTEKTFQVTDRRSQCPSGCDYVGDWGNCKSDGTRERQVDFCGTDTGFTCERRTQEHRFSIDSSLYCGSNDDDDSGGSGDTKDGVRTTLGACIYTCTDLDGCICASNCITSGKIDYAEDCDGIEPKGEPRGTCYEIEGSNCNTRTCPSEFLCISILNCYETIDSCNHALDLIGKGNGNGVIKDKTQLSLTKKEWDKATAETIMKSTCAFANQCKLREGYEISCISDSDVKSKIRNAESAFEDIVLLVKRITGLGIIQDGTCRATKGFDWCSMPHIEFGDYECQNLVLIEYIGGIFLIFMFINMMKS